MQYGILARAANAVVPFVIVAQPPFRAAELTKDAGLRWVQVRDLERLGFLLDISDIYQDLLADEKIIYGRAFKVYTLTAESHLLFKEANERLPN